MKSATSSRCGNCCKGEGAVEIGPREADRLAAYLGMSRKDFLRRYTLATDEGRWWLLDQENEEKWCIFLRQDEEGRYGCRVNAAKPRQCRSFPAKWRNEDSFRSCAGLRRIMERLRGEAKAAAAPE